MCVKRKEGREEVGDHKAVYIYVCVCVKERKKETRCDGRGSV